MLLFYRIFWPFCPLLGEFSVFPPSERARVKCCGWGSERGRGGREVYSLSLNLSSHLFSLKALITSMATSAMINNIGLGGRFCPPLWQIRLYLHKQTVTNRQKDGKATYKGKSFRSAQKGNKLLHYMIQPMPNRGTNPTEFVCFISGFVFVVFDFKAIKKSVNWVGLSYLPPPFSDIWSKALF